MSIAHVVLPPRRVPQSGYFYTECTCGAVEVAESRDAAREAMQPCRTAAAKRAGSDRPNATLTATGKHSQTVDSAVKAEGPSDQLGPSAKDTSGP